MNMLFRPRRTAATPCAPAPLTVAAVTGASPRDPARSIARWLPTVVGLALGVVGGAVGPSASDTLASAATAAPASLPGAAGSSGSGAPHATVAPLAKAAVATAGVDSGGAQPAPDDLAAARFATTCAGCHISPAPNSPGPI